MALKIDSCHETRGVTSSPSLLLIWGGLDGKVSRQVCNGGVCRLTGSSIRSEETKSLLTVPLLGNPSQREPLCDPLLPASASITAGSGANAVWGSGGQRLINV